MPDQVLSLAFASGIDTRTDKKYVAPGKLLACLNGAFDKTGAIRKRPGSIAQPTVTQAIQNSGYTVGPAALPANPAGRFGFGKQDCHLAGFRIYSESPQQNAQLDLDYFSECVATWKNIGGQASVASYVDPAVAYCNGYLVYAWYSNLQFTGVGSPLGGGTMYALVYEAATGALVSTNKFTGGSGINPKLVVLGTTVICVWQTLGAGQQSILAATLDTTALPLDWSGNTVLTTSLVACSFDVYASSSSTFLLSHYVASTGVKVVRYNAALSALTTSNAFGSNSLTATVTAIYGTVGEQAVVAWSDPTIPAIYALGIDPTTLASTWGGGTTTVFTSSTGSDTPYQLALTRSTSTETLITWQDSANIGIPITAITQPAIGMATLSSSGAAYSPSFPLGVALLSRPFQASTGLTYALVWYPSAIQGTIFLVHISASAAGRVWRPVATILPRQALAPTLPAGTAYVSAQVRDSGGLGAVASPSAGVYVFPGFGAVGSGMIGMQNLQQITLDFTAPGRCVAAPMGASMVLGSGMPCSFDGQTMAEQAFLTFPEGSQVTQTTGGSLTLLGTYQWCIVYEWTDARGQVYQSSPGVPFGLTLTGANNAAIIQFPYPALSQKTQGPAPSATIRVVIYRSGGTNGQGVFYDTQLCSAYMITSGMGGYYAITDGVADSVLTNGNATILYTTGGVLQNLCPASFLWTWTHRNRVFGIDGGQRIVWRSNELTEGVSVTWNDNLNFTCDDGNDLVAGASMDEKCLLFTAKSIYYVIGDGPNNLGAGDDYGIPQRITSDVGCIDPRSIVPHPDGTLFLSSKGLCILTRGLQVIYLDGPEDYVTAMPQMSGQAVLVPERQEVRFPMTNGESGQVLVLNYFEPPEPFKYKWSVWSYYDAGASQAACIVSAAAYVNGSYRWTSSAGKPYVEDTAGTTWMDGGSASANWVTLSVSTAWVATNGIEGFQRVKRVAVQGDRYTSHDLTVAVASDYNPSTVPPSGNFVTWSSDIIDHAGSLEELRLFVTNQKGHALQCTVTDAYPTGLEAVVGSGRGLSLSAIALRYATKEGLGKKLPQAQTG